jgi:hypothetical protein
MTRYHVLLLFSIVVLSAFSAQAQQISLIPITDTASSNGAFVRGMSNDGKRILFESSNDYTGENKDGNNEIFVYDVGSRKVIQITQTGNQTSGGAGAERRTSLARPQLSRRLPAQNVFFDQRGSGDQRRWDARCVRFDQQLADRPAERGRQCRNLPGGIAARRDGGDFAANY